MIGILSRGPFFVTGPFVGPIAQSLGSVDYSIFIGLPVSAIAYLILAKGIDLKKERSLASAEGNNGRGWSIKYNQEMCLQTF